MSHAPFRAAGREHRERQHNKGAARHGNFAHDHEPPESSHCISTIAKERKERSGVEPHLHPPRLLRIHHLSALRRGARAMPSTLSVDPNARPLPLLHSVREISLARAPAAHAVHFPADMRALFALFDHSDDVQFWIKDAHGSYRWINRGFLLNYSMESPAQVLGKTDFELSPPYIASKFRMDDDRVLAGVPVTSRIELVGRFDHTAVWCVTDKVALRDTRGQVYATAGICSPIKGRDLAPSVDDVALGKVIVLFHERYAERWHNDDLAKLSNLSLRAFERRFLKTIGMPAQVYLRRVRVREATRELVFSKRTLAEIAVACGFADQSHLTREFRRETKMTPAAYRKLYASAT